MSSKLHAIMDHCCNLCSNQLIGLYVISRTLPDLGRLGQKVPPPWSLWSILRRTPITMSPISVEELSKRADDAETITS